MPAGSRSRSPSAIASRRLIGAAAGEVVLGDSTSASLFQVAVAAARLRPERRVVVSERGNFPTDLYVLESVQELLGGTTPLERRLIADDGPTLDELLDEDVAIVVLTHVDYRTGRMHDMAEVTRRVHAAGAIMVWDLCHSVGAVPVDLNGAGADFAIGCTYKYLNGGPGSPSFIWVAEAAPCRRAARPHRLARPRQAVRLRRRLRTGERDRPIPRRHAPAALGGGARGEPRDLERGRPRAAAGEEPSTHGAVHLARRLPTRPVGRRGRHPRQSARRGSQIALRLDDGYAVMQALIERGVIGDFRAPDIMRFGFAPLYVSHADVWDAVAALELILATGAWREPRFARRGAVT